MSRFLSENLISRKSGSGIKRKTKEREDHLIVREVVKNCRISVSQLKQNLNLEHLCNNKIVARIKVGKEFTSGWQTKKPIKQEKLC